jgi:molybdopterin-binding protein
MAKAFYSASEAAQALGISLDTLRRWDKQGRISVGRDASNRRIVNAAEIGRLRGSEEHISARNRFHGTVTDVKVDGLMAQVELTVNEPMRLVALVTRDAVEELGLKAGMPATAIVKSTNVMVQS